MGFKYVNKIFVNVVNFLIKKKYNIINLYYFSLLTTFKLYKLPHNDINTNTQLTDHGPDLV